MALPEGENEPFGGQTPPCYRVNDKIFCGTGQDGRARINFKAARGVQEALVGSDPERFFVPQYTGPKGWVGAWPDVEPAWDESAELAEECDRLTAPRTLAAHVGE